MQFKIIVTVEAPDESAANEIKDEIQSGLEDILVLQEEEKLLSIELKLEPIK